MKAFMMLTEFTNVHKNGSNPIVLHVTSDFGTFVMSLLDGKQEGHELVLEKMCNVVLLWNSGHDLAMCLVLYQFPHHQLCSIGWLWFAIKSKKQFLFYKMRFEDGIKLTSKD